MFVFLLFSFCCLLCTFQYPVKWDCRMSQVLVLLNDMISNYDIILERVSYVVIFFHSTVWIALSRCTMTHVLFFFLSAVVTHWSVKAALQLQSLSLKVLSFVFELLAHWEHFFYLFILTRSFLVSVAVPVITSKFLYISRATFFDRLESAINRIAKETFKTSSSWSFTQQTSKTTSGSITYCSLFLFPQARISRPSHEIDSAVTLRLFVWWWCMHATRFSQCLKTERMYLM